MLREMVRIDLAPPYFALAAAGGRLAAQATPPDHPARS
jgi:hypothetical protein